MIYSYGIPGKLIWTTHIIIGIILFYIGYNLLNNVPINKNLAILLVILGSLAMLYHAHLFYTYSTSNINPNQSIPTAS